MAWFRLDTDFYQNDEICSVTHVTRYAVTSIIAYIKAHGAKGKVKATPTQIARSMDVPVENVKEALTLSLFSVEGKMIEVVAWNDFQSDPTAAGRMARYREKKSDSNCNERNNRNVTLVTPTGQDRIGQDNTPHNHPKVSSSQDQYLKSFDDFWEVYPRKVAKAKAKSIWLKLKPSQELTQQIIKAVQTLTQTEQWLKDDGKFIPYPATWLNHRRWEDELPQKRFSRLDDGTLVDINSMYSDGDGPRNPTPEDLVLSREESI